MKILYELSWLWEMLGIALVAAAVCMACAALIGKAAKKKLSKKLLAVIGAGIMQMAVEHKRLVGDMFAEYGIILMEITQSTLG